MSAEDDPAAASPMDADVFLQNSLKTIGSAIALSNGLPSVKDTRVFYSAFPAFRKVMGAERKAVEKSINQVLRISGIETELSSNATGTHFLELVGEANVQILDRVNTALDELASMGKKSHEGIGLAPDMSPRPVEISSSKHDVKLIAAKNVLRPQIRFKSMVDNSDKPFVPRLTEKPNSKKPLSVLVEYDEEGEERYSHPYLYELNTFQIPDAQVHAVNELDLPDHSNLVYVDTVDQLKEVVTALKRATEIAVDLEHHWYRSFQGITSLIQFSTPTKDVIIDPFPLWAELTMLNEVMTDPGIIKIFHGADNDLMWLQRDFSIYVVNMFDTHQAAISLNFPAGCRSLSFLLEKYFGKKTDKRFQLADWRIRPLPNEMLEYARSDTRYLISLHRKMKNQLLERGNEFGNLLLSMTDTCTSMCKRVYSKPRYDDSSHVSFLRKSRVNFNARQTYAAKHVFEWRQKVAREEDESEQFVLPNHMLLKICMELPREMQGILACCSPMPPLVKQNQQILHMIILKAREQPMTAIRDSLECVEKGRIQNSGSMSQRSAKAMGADIAENPLQSPLDQSNISKLAGPTVLDDEHPKATKAATKGFKTRRRPRVSVFAARSSQMSPRGSTPIKHLLEKQFLGPYKRYQLLAPYLKYLQTAESPSK